MNLPIEHKCFVATERLAVIECETRGDRTRRIDEAMAKLRESLQPHVDQSLRSEITVRCGTDAKTGDFLIMAQLLHYPIERATT
jgi:hypothetical protein